MTEKSITLPIPPERRERLVLIFHQKRASLIFFYVFGVVMVITGVGFMAATAYGSIARNSLAWNIGAATIILGILLFTWTEIRRQFKLYIITTWNVRVRRGILRRKTVRVFYDEISEVRTTANPVETKVGMGDVEICSGKADNSPAIVFEEVENPDGVRELISRFVQTIPDPLPWGHLDRR
ncbi:PH domain-containing protein [Candidatus Thorarchaeota archaeon]|nr:MAG: PH domain-containing protein [Candidatus Thorarchaeota archaeon]